MGVTIKFRKVASQNTVARLKVRGTMGKSKAITMIVSVLFGLGLEW
jgi:hypothetical protein